ncbi:hypothetical protein FB45DRAFT_1064112 [Roridomyces roridus]|uniref:Uncharacterized protein n=1 Tax=Roridomyces roridus TaxID=1738132 RepID=A0AAD7BAU8_9AGAR|nr:hypothetical protein FB45DRAFT_1064112 [Roridomyces roridus]
MPPSRRASVVSASSKVFGRPFESLRASVVRTARRRSLRRHTAMGCTFEFVTPPTPPASSVDRRQSTLSAAPLLQRKSSSLSISLSEFTQRNQSCMSLASVSSDESMDTVDSAETVTPAGVEGCMMPSQSTFFHPPGARPLRRTSKSTRRVKRCRKFVWAVITSIVFVPTPGVTIGPSSYR